MELKIPQLRPVRMQKNKTKQGYRNPSGVEGPIVAMNLDIMSHLKPSITSHFFNLTSAGFVSKLSLTKCHRCLVPNLIKVT